MIKIFRNIRRRLLRKNRFTRYLIYAIGEIILVVIGILIALQINDWNEKRKRLNTEDQYYCKLKEDVEQDIINIQYQIRSNDRRILNNNKLLNVIQRRYPSHPEVMKYIRGSVVNSYFTFEPTKAAFQDLKSSGNLGLLRDLEIKEALLNYYSNIEGLKRVVDINSEKTMALLFDNNRDFRELGFQHVSNLLEAIDTNLVDIQELALPDYPSPEVRKRITSDALFYLAASSRKRQLYAEMEREIHKMHDILQSKRKFK